MPLFAFGPPHATPMATFAQKTTLLFGAPRPTLNDRTPAGLLAFRVNTPLPPSQPQKGQ